jgi:alpha-galactosidase
VFTRQLLHDILRVPGLGEIEIALHDIDLERLETARLAAEQIRDRCGAAGPVTATTERVRALEGADFVINMVQVGGVDATRTDFAVPARFGLRQTIADTLGPGGVFRALRTFPVLRQITDDMTRVCPDAILLNYTNPMAMNVWWLAETAPQIRSVGLCHSVYWTVRNLSALLGLAEDEVDYRAAGVNHQAWLLRWEHQGEDLYPRLRELVTRDEQLRRRVRVDVFRRFGYYPTETSEHSSEYLPWYLHHDDEVQRLRIPVGAYLGISEDNLREYRDTREALRRGEPLGLHEEVNEYAPRVVEAMVLGTPATIHANVANKGLIANLPEGSAVEVPCTLDRLGVHPQQVGALPAQCAALNRMFLSVAELTVRAAIEEDPMMVRQALLLDPNTCATLRVEDVFAMCDALVEAHGPLLPAWLHGRVRY